LKALGLGPSREALETGSFLKHKALPHPCEYGRWQTDWQVQRHERSPQVSKKASPDAAVVAAAYRTLRHYFPAGYASLDASYAEALAAIPDGPAKLAGVKIGQVAADQVIRARSIDGLTTPIAISSSFPTLKPGPGVWRLTPPFAPAQIPWAANVHPFILQSAAQFLPAPPPSLSSPDWVSAFNEVEAYGGANSTVRTVAQTAVAQF
jgi:hypothetical protein